jgi:hypothetical protein
VRHDRQTSEVRRLHPGRRSLVHQVVSVTWPPTYVATIPLGELLARYMMVSDDPEPLLLGDALIAAGWTPPSEDS